MFELTFFLHSNLTEEMYLELLQNDFNPILAENIEDYEPIS